MDTGLFLLRFVKRSSTCKSGFFVADNRRAGFKAFVDCPLATLDCRPDRQLFRCEGLIEEELGDKYAFVIVLLNENLGPPALSF